MLLILEIILTVTVWNRGFKAWALLPILSALGLGFAIGMASPGLLEDGNILSLIWLDILAIVALLFMAAVGRSESETDPQTEPEIQDPSGEPHETNPKLPAH